MSKDINQIQKDIEKIEKETQSPDFWADKNKAQEVLQELAVLEEELEGVGKYDKGNAIITIISGAGGDDAEDFSRILVEMYSKLAKRKGWDISCIHEHKNRTEERRVGKG